MDSSLLAKRKTDSNFPNVKNVCSSNNILEFSSKSLLVHNTRQPIGLFSEGDRLVPLRPEETLYQGEQIYMHEENLLSNKRRRNERREERR